jgi:lactose/L-arabinose transport system substrate-binding protein
MVKYGVYNYEARTAVTRGFMDILQGRLSVDAALDAAQREVDFIVGQ